jgi:DNA-binding response OmpR family regulator
MTISTRTLIEMRLTPLEFDFLEALLESHPNPVSVKEATRIFRSKSVSSMRVLAHKFKEKLNRKGMTVWTIFGVGYRLSDETFAALKQENEA